MMDPAFEYDIIVGHLSWLVPTTQKSLQPLIDIIIQSKEDYGYIDMLELLESMILL